MVNTAPCPYGFKGVIIYKEKEGEIYGICNIAREADEWSEQRRMGCPYNSDRCYYAKGRWLRI